MASKITQQATKKHYLKGKKIIEKYEENRSRLINKAIYRIGESFYSEILNLEKELKTRAGFNINQIRHKITFHEFKQLAWKGVKNWCKSHNYNDIKQTKQIVQRAFLVVWTGGYPVYFAKNKEQEILNKRNFISKKSELISVLLYYYIEYKKQNPILKKFKNKILLLTGKTGTGKTYNAVKKGEKTGRFLYLAPCRQLAYETAIKYGNIGDTILTGESHIKGKKDGNVFAVYESAKNINPNQFDILLVDEFHYISDPDRGWDIYQILNNFQNNNIPIIGMTATNTISPNIEEKLNLKEKKLKPFKKIPKKIKVNKDKFYENVRNGYKSIIFVKYTPGWRKKDEVAWEANINEDDIEIISSATPPAERLKIQLRFAAGKINLLLATNVLAQGLNFPAENIMIEYNEWDSPEIIEQKKGRLGRPFQSKRDKVYYTVRQVPPLKKNKKINVNNREKTNKCKFAQKPLQRSYKEHQIPKSLKEYKAYRYGKKLLEELIKTKNIKEEYKNEVHNAYKRIKEEEKEIENIIRNKREEK